MHGVIGSPITILQGDCRRLLATLPAESVHCVVTSPPYWGLRAYLPDTVKIRKDLAPEKVAQILEELNKTGVYAIDAIRG